MQWYLQLVSSVRQNSFGQAGSPVACGSVREVGTVDNAPVPRARVLRAGRSRRRRRLLKLGAARPAGSQPVGFYLVGDRGGQRRRGSFTGTLAIAVDRAERRPVGTAAFGGRSRRRTPPFAALRARRRAHCWRKTQKLGAPPPPFERGPGLAGRSAPATRPARPRQRKAWSYSQGKRGA